MDSMHGQGCMTMQDALFPLGRLEDQAGGEAAQWRETLAAARFDAMDVMYK